MRSDRVPAVKRIKTFQPVHVNVDETRQRSIDPKGRPAPVHRSVRHARTWIRALDNRDRRRSRACPPRWNPPGRTRSAPDRTIMNVIYR